MPHLVTATGPTTPGPAESPLVGREREQATLRDALAAALAGRGSLVLIGGEAGIGKTTLAEALCREATAHGALALIGRCYDLSETPPYGPWRGVFAKVAREAALPALPAAVLPADQVGEELTSQTAIFARLHDALPDESLDLPFNFATPLGNRRLLMRELVLAGCYDEARAMAVALEGNPHGVGMSDQMVQRAPHYRGSEGHAHLAWAVIYAATGEHTEARVAFARARLTYREVRFHDLLGWAATQELRWLHIPYSPDSLPERQALADEAAAGWALAREQRADLAPSTTEATVARLPLLLIAGPWDEAAALIEPVLRGEPVALWPRLLMGDLGRLAYLRGEVESAWALVRRMLPEGPAADPGDREFEPALVLLRLAADLALDAGDRDQARAWLAAHDRWLSRNGTTLGRAEGHLGWAAYHRTGGDTVAARQHAEAARLAASVPRQPLALLAAHRLLGELAVAEANRSAARMEVDQALALAEACAAPYERALCLLAIAELQVAAGERAAASATVADATALLEPLGARPALARAAAIPVGPDGPPLRGSVSLPFGLTVREAEVLRLVAEGLTDPQVAAQLFVSRNTVGTHLKAIFSKLGVNTRAAAARLALEHGLA